MHTHTHTHTHTECVRVCMFVHVKGIIYGHEFAYYLVNNTWIRLVKFKVQVSVGPRNVVIIMWELF